MSLQEKSIKILLYECKSEIKNFQNTHDVTCESSSCDEIVRRAAAGNLDALRVLLYDITRPVVEQRCPSDLKTQSDDLIQDVLLRLLRKFYHSDSPFIAQGFPAYRHYLNLKIIEAISSLRVPYKLSPLEDLSERSIEFSTIKGEIQAHSTMEQNETVREIIRRITNPTGREIIRRQYVDNESYDEILAALKLIDPSMSKKKIYKLAENSLKQLKKSFGVEQI